MAAPDKSVWLYSVCLKNGIRLEDGQLKLLELFVSGLLEWNGKVNLISRRDEENIWEKHILHSILLLFRVWLPIGSRVLDLGSGGGLPGIPLKVVRPDLSVTLLDATQKKVKAVNDIIAALGLSDIKAVWGRAEDLGKEKGYAGGYDLVVARAVAPLNDLARWSRSFLKKASQRPEKDATPPPRSFEVMVSKPTLIAFKGGDLENEISHLRKRTDIGSVSTIEFGISGTAQLEGGDKKLVVVEFPNT